MTVQNATSFGTNDVTIIFIGYCIRMEIYFVDTKIVSEYDQKNITLTNCRQTHGTASHHTNIARQEEDKTSKATSSLFPIKMIAILEWT